MTVNVLVLTFIVGFVSAETMSPSPAASLMPSFSSSEWSSASAMPSMIASECSANPSCRDLSLMGDCCPTPQGVYLGCCFGEDSEYNQTMIPTSTVDPNATAAPTTFEQCSVHPACEGLVDDCCPTSEGTFLYCCFETDDKSKYGVDFSLVASSGTHDADRADYFASTALYYDNVTAPDGASSVIYYVRNATEAYDLIYYATESIGNASDYISGISKFYMDVYSLAPVCTQVMLQLDSLALASSDNYPHGRHSRYVAQTTTSNQWERLEFDLLDQPDETLPDDSVDAIALFFSPGLYLDDAYYFRNLDSASIGWCSGDTCEDIPPKNCSAIFDGEEGSCGDGLDNDNDGLIDCEDPECTLDTACVVSVRSAYTTAKYQVRTTVSDDDESSNATAQALMWSMTLLVASVLVFVAV
eukprot:Nitzschia sp. Nitz4//scaffold220_size35126//30209//31614//NITZ4_007836-RA/size35126-snap-gene-0.3-mRNA-1//-1//CDS//3329542547//7541//frame0